MAVAQPHLEHRPTGYFWRRRVPSRASNRFNRPFFCFPLKTHVLREAAGLARRLTAISDLCFDAENAVSPDAMTHILTDYARLEIELADRLRARTGPRTREAAEASLALESAARAALRDAIFLCDRSPALPAIRETADRLGIPVDEAEEDFGVLADRMIRLMIEVSEEKERRARGHFSRPQPYLDMALNGLSEAALPRHPVAPGYVPAPAATPTATENDEAVAAQAAVAEMDDAQDDPRAGATDLEASGGTAAATDAGDSNAPSPIFYARDGLNITVNTAHGAPARALDGSDPRIIDLWDAWFDEMSRGVRSNGAFHFEDAGAAQRFTKDSDTVRATRRLVVDVFGETRVSQADGSLWMRFNDTLRALPNNHGRSARLRDLDCFQFIEHERKQESIRLQKARKEIQRRGLAGDEAEELLRKARTTTIAPRTFQRHQKYLSAPLDHAVTKRQISHNPFKPYVVGQRVIDDMRKSAPDTKRQLWTSADLAALLSTPPWSSEKTRIDDHVYWVPLIARLHGLRSEEILQLKPTDVKCDDGIHYFDITLGTGQSLKSQNARRLVPIHSQLIELGFLTLVEHQRKRGAVRIFDRAKRSKTKRLSFTGNFTKTFNYRRRTNGIYELRKDLHALRTTFHQKMADALVPDTARRYLMGHRNDDVGITNYLPEGFSLATLKQCIEMQRIDLSMVTRRFSQVRSARRGPRLAARDGIALRT